MNRYIKILSESNGISFTYLIYGDNDAADSNKSLNFDELVEDSHRFVNETVKLPAGRYLSSGSANSISSYCDIRSVQTPLSVDVIIFTPELSTAMSTEPMFS